MNRISLALALGASALTGTLLGATPVGHAAARAILPPGSVGAVQLKAGSVNSAKVKDGTLLARDFKTGQLPAGPRGGLGPQGPQGERGPAGAPGISGTATIAADSISSEKVADHSLRIADSAVASGQVHINLPSIAAQSCINRPVSIAIRQPKDMLVLQPTRNIAEGLVLMPLFDVDEGPWFTIRVCNVTGSPVDSLEGAWGYAVYR